MIVAPELTVRANHSVRSEWFKVRAVGQDREFKTLESV